MQEENPNFVDGTDGTGAETPPVSSIPQAKALTKEKARDLRVLLARYVRRHLPPPSPPVAHSVEPPKVQGTYASVLKFLRIIPLFLGLVFALSFFWDFDGMRISVLGYVASIEGLLRILSVSGLIGFFTNWLAITMLFNPRQKRPIFGQGLIPAQRERVIFRLAQAVSKELINEHIIKQKIEESGVIARYRETALGVTRAVLEDPDFRRDIKELTADYAQKVLGSEETRKMLTQLIVEKVEQNAGQGFGGLALKTYRFLNEADFQRRIDKAVRDLPTSLDGALSKMDALLDRLPQKIEARSEEIEQWVTRIILGFVENLDVYDMIITNMKQYDEQQLENLLKNTSNEQLNYIKYLGGVLGVIGGLVIWKPTVSLILFGVLGVTLYVVDELIFRARNRQVTGS